MIEGAKPILFNTAMVQSILHGLKTETRRIVKYKYSNTKMKMRTDKYGTEFIEIQKNIEGETFGKNPDGTGWQKILGYIEKEPQYKKGDILYVRETWQQGSLVDGNDQIIEGTETYFYAAGPDEVLPTYDYWVDPETGKHKDIMPWRPSIHMPKEAARIFLQVTNVRAERLQDIDIDGIRKEGLTSMAVEAGDTEIALLEWGNLWNSTIKKNNATTNGWEANPWVWVIEFKRMEEKANV